MRPGLGSIALLVGVLFLVGPIHLFSRPLDAQVVPPEFSMSIPDIAVPYDIVTGLGSVEGTIRLEETTPGGGVGTPVIAFVTVVRHDPAVLFPVSWSFSPALYSVLPGLGAIDVFPALSDSEDALAIGLLFDLAGVPALLFPAEIDLVSFQYLSVPTAFAGNPVGAVTELAFDETQLFAGELLQNGVYSGFGVTTPAFDDGTISLTPLTIGVGFVRGDVNSDGAVQISDAIAGLEYLLGLGGPNPACLDALDSNDDGQLNIADPIVTLFALFVAGTGPLPDPYPFCGPDPSPDGLVGPSCGDPVGCP